MCASAVSMVSIHPHSRCKLKRPGVPLYAVCCMLYAVRSRGAKALPFQVKLRRNDYMTVLVQYDQEKSWPELGVVHHNVTPLYKRFCKQRYKHICKSSCISTCPPQAAKNTTRRLIIGLL